MIINKITWVFHEFKCHACVELESVNNIYICVKCD